MKNLHSPKHTSYKKVQIGSLLSILLLFTFIIPTNAQQVIGTFNFMDGGFEGQTVAAVPAANSISSGATSSTWTVTTAGVGTIQSTVARTGTKSCNFYSSSTTKRLQSPTLPAPAQQAASSTAYTIQYYYRTAGSTATATTMQAGLSAAGTGDGSYTTAVAFSGTSGSWVKYSTAFTTKSGTTPSSPVGIVRESIAMVTAIDIDDFCIYPGSLDTTSPDAPTAPSIPTPSSTQMTISWTAPSTGVDGGGYMLVRGLSDPTTVPNTNGIYAIGNTVAAGEQVVYVGTGTSFNDTGLTPSTIYYYRIYTVDKAFNYSSPIMVNASTTAPNYATEPTAQTSNMIFSGVSSSGFTISWDAAALGCGTNHLVVVKPGSDLSTDPVDGSSYIADPTFGNGSNVGGGSVVYNGTGTSVTITGLSKLTTYYVRIYDFNGSAGTENYLADNSLSANQSTLPGEILSTGSNSAGVTWATASAWIGGVVPTASDNVTIATGDKIQIAASASCYNLTIQNGAKLYNNVALPTSSVVYLTAYGNSITCNGTLGDKVDASTADCALGINFNGNLTINGGGIIRLGRIRPNTGTQNATLTIASNTEMTYTGSAGTGGSGIYADNSGNDNITITVNPETVLSFVDYSNFNTSSNSTLNAGVNTVFNIYGTVNMLTNSYLSLTVTSGKTCTLNVSGTVNAANLNATGGAAPAINITGSGKIYVSGTADFSSPTLSAIATGSGRFELKSGATIKISASTGLEPVAGAVRSTIRSFSTGANYSYVGTAIQNTGSDLPATVNNLTINNSNGVTLDGTTTVTGILSLTSGKLTLGNNNIIMGTSGVISGASATNYIVTNSTGLLTQNVAAATEKLFPIGSASSYTPASVNPTNATDISINTGTTLPAAAPLNYTYNQFVWDISSSNPSSTILTLTPASAIATSARDVIGHFNGSGYDHVTATKNGSSYSATFSTFSPFVTGTSDVGTGIVSCKLNTIYFDGKTIWNPEHKAIQLFDSKGRKVLTCKDAQLEVSNGFFILVSDEGKMKIIK